METADADIKPAEYTPTKAELAAARLAYGENSDPQVTYRRFPWLRKYHPQLQDKIVEPTE